MTRTVLISGATKGIGLALARRLAASGHAVLGLGRQRNSAAFLKLARERGLLKAGGRQRSDPRTSSG